MRQIRRSCATLAVLLALAIPVAAGEIPNPTGGEPPAPDGQVAVTTETTDAAGDICFPLGLVPTPLAETLQSLLGGLILLP